MKFILTLLYSSFTSLSLPPDYFILWLPSLTFLCFHASLQRMHVSLSILAVVVIFLQWCYYNNTGEHLIAYCLHKVLQYDFWWTGHCRAFNGADVF